MKKLLLLSVLLLGGCAEISNAYNIAVGASVTPQQAYIAANAFDAVEATATNYLLLPVCGTTASKLCRTPAAVSAIVPAVRIGRLARINLENAVTASNGQPVSASLYAALTAQSSTLQAIIGQYQIGQ